MKIRQDIKKQRDVTEYSMFKSLHTLSEMKRVREIVRSNQQSSGKICVPT